MTTRRTFLAGIALPVADAAHQLPVPAALLRDAERHPDAELFDLERRWRPADAAYIAASEREEALECVGHPEAPDALLYRDSDWDIGLNQLALTGQDGVARFWLLGDTSSAMRGQHTRFGYVPIPPGHRLYAPGRMMTSRVPWPERQTRADEIVAAWDRWQAEIAAAEEASGYTEAKAEAGRAGTAAGDIERAIETAKPRTLDGLAVKARLLRVQVGRNWEVDEFAAAVADDILRLAGGVA